MVPAYLPACLPACLPPCMLKLLRYCQRESMPKSPERVGLGSSLRGSLLKCMGGKAAWSRWRSPGKGCRLLEMPREAGGAALLNALVKLP